MSFSIIYVFRTHRQWNIVGNFALINLLVNIPSAVIIIIFLVGYFQNNTVLVDTSDKIYYVIRLVTIFVNFMAYFYTVTFVSTLKEYCFGKEERLSEYESRAEKAIKELVNRLKYYPVIKHPLKF